MTNIPENIHQMIADPWAALLGGEVTSLWAAADNGIWYKENANTIWVKKEFEYDDILGEGRDYDDIIWVACTGNICLQGSFAFLGYYINDSGDPRTIVADTIDYGLNFRHKCLTDPVMYGEWLATFPGGPCNYPQPHKTGFSASGEGGKLDVDGDYSVFGQWGNCSGCSDVYPVGALVFPDIVSAGAGYKLYIRGTGTWAAGSGSYCWRVTVSSVMDYPEMCDGHVQVGIWSSPNPDMQNPASDQTKDLDIVVGWVPGGIVDGLWLAVGAWYACPPGGTGMSIDAVWINKPDVPRFPYNIRFDTATGTYAYLTTWAPWAIDDPAPDEWLIELWRINARGEGAGSPQKVHGPNAHNSVADGHPTYYQYDYPQHHVYVHHPYGFGDDELMLFGGQYDADQGDTRPVVWYCKVTELNDCVTCTRSDRHPPLEWGKYVGHMSAATKNQADLIAIINQHTVNTCEMRQSLSGGFGWFPPKAMLDGLVRHDGAHRHPADGKYIVVGQGIDGNRVLRTDNTGDDWTDITAAALPGGIKPTSAFWDYMKKAS